MKTITRNDLKGLGRVFPELSNEEKQGIVGGSEATDLVTWLNENGIGFYENADIYRWFRYAPEGYTYPDLYGDPHTWGYSYSYIGDTPMMIISFLSCLSHITGRSLTTYYNEYKAYLSTIPRNFFTLYPEHSYIPGYFETKNYGYIDYYNNGNIENFINTYAKPVLAKLYSEQQATSGLYKYSANRYVVITSCFQNGETIYYTYYDPILDETHSEAYYKFSAPIYKLTADSLTNY